MEKELISIIIPVYNLEKYISKCLESVLSQTYPNIEVIIVNDGSTDNTSHIIEKYENENNNVKVVNSENEGVTKARIRGVKASSGDWIGFVDGDDYIEPNMYEILYSNAKKYDVDISHCGYKMVFPNGREDFYYGTGRIKVQDNFEGQKDLLDGDFIEPAVWNKLYKKTLLNEFINKDTMNDTIRINEDLLMNYYLFKMASKSVYFDAIPYHYLVRGNSAANTKMNINHLSDPTKVLRIIEKDTSNNKKLNSIVKNRLLNQMIRLSSLSTTKIETLLINYCKEERKNLINSLLSIIMGDYAFKTKIKACLAGMLPRCYRFVHDLYLKKTGLDKKYSVE